LDRDSKTIFLGQGVVFCFRAILNLGLSYVLDSNFGQILNGVRGSIFENAE
jgi:hypothetical protein